MRKALNENQTVQLVVLAVVGVIFAFIVYSTVLSGDDTPKPDPNAPPIVAGEAPPPAPEEPADEPAPEPPAPAADAGAPADPVAPPPSPGGSVDADGLVPTAGLPSDALVPLAKGDALALLVIDPKGISDEQVRAYTQRLSGRNDVSVVVVDAKDVADYARITAGVQVNRTPALVVVQPRGGDGAQLVASVSYGFRSPKSIETALEDALFSGETVGAGPG